MKASLRSLKYLITCDLLKLKSWNVSKIRYELSFADLHMTKPEIRDENSQLNNSRVSLIAGESKVNNFWVKKTKNKHTGVLYNVLYRENTEMKFLLDRDNGKTDRILRQDTLNSNSDMYVYKIIRNH